MPKKTGKKDVKDVKGTESFSTMNKAKAAFDEYKNKMATGTLKTGIKGLNAGHAMPLPGNPMPGQMHSQPYMQMMQPPFQMPPGMVPQPGILNQQTPVAPYMGQSGGPLFNSLGSMLRLGIDLVNAGLAGGLQLMEGFYGGRGGGHHHGNGYEGNSCCCEPDCCSEQPSCCGPCDTCNPSVNNCC